MSAFFHQSHPKVEIHPAKLEDAAPILSLQKLAYQSQAAIYRDYSIAPLTQTLAQIKADFEKQVFLKAVVGEMIVGSVRARARRDSCYVGRLIVHPDWQGRGIGTKLMHRIEACFPNVHRFELFTGIKSQANIRLYKRLGYTPFREQAHTEAVILVFMEKIIQ